MLSCHAVAAPDLYAGGVWGTCIGVSQSAVDILRLQLACYALAALCFVCFDGLDLACNVQ
jgi:hypothetical protein